MLGGVVLAAATAFGVGARDVASQIAEKAYSQGRQTADQASSSSGGSSGNPFYADGSTNGTTASPEPPRRPSQR